VPSVEAGPRIETVIPLALRSVEPSVQPPGRSAAAGTAPHAAERHAERSVPRFRKTAAIATIAVTSATSAIQGAAAARKLWPSGASSKSWSTRVGLVNPRRGLVRRGGMRRSDSRGRVRAV
jgi:hypothetical protein